METVTVGGREQLFRYASAPSGEHQEPDESPNGRDKQECAKAGAEHVTEPVAQGPFQQEGRRADDEHERDVEGDARKESERQSDNQTTPQEQESPSSRVIGNIHCASE